MVSFQTAWLAAWLVVSYEKDRIILAAGYHTLYTMTHLMHSIGIAVARLDAIQDAVKRLAEKANVQPDGIISPDHTTKIAQLVSVASASITAHAQAIQDLPLERECGDDLVEGA